MNPKIVIAGAILLAIGLWLNSASEKSAEEQKQAAEHAEMCQLAAFMGSSPGYLNSMGCR